jgi:hypothetical protein
VNYRKLSRRVLLQLVINATTIALISCSDPSDATRIDDADAQAGEGSRIDPSLTFMPESVARDLDNLQLAIDLNLEERVVDCMSNQGFEYLPMSVDEIRVQNGLNGAGYDVSNSAQRALDSIFSSATAEVPPSNQATVSDLSESELAAWREAVLECRVSESGAQESPWELIGTDWYLELQQEAASLTSNDSEYLDAIEESRRCFSEHGYGGDPEGLVDDANTRTADVVQQYMGGQISEKEAGDELTALAQNLDRLAEMFELCDKPRFDVEQRVNARYLNEIADENSLEMVEWVDAVERELTDYREELDRLR